MQGLLPAGASRFDVVAAYYAIAADYHSGQWSKGYRKLSQCVRMGFSMGLADPRRDEEMRCHMAALLWKRRREIKKEW